MADGVSDKLIDIASGGIGKAQEGFREGAGAVMGVANFVNQTQQNRQKLEAQKAQLEQQKTTAVLSSINTGLTKVPKSARKSFFTNFVGKQAESLGIPIDPETLNLIASDDALSNEAALGLSRLLQNPSEANFGEAIKMLNNPEQALNFLSEGLNREARTEELALRLGQQQQLAQQRERVAEVKTTRSAKRDLSKELIKNGIPAAELTIEKLDKIIPGGIDGFTGEVNIPGLGGLSGKLPTGALSKEGREVRQLAIGLANQILKARSGGAVTPSEAGRVLTELGIDLAPGEGGGFTALFTPPKSDQDFVNGLKNARDALLRGKATLEEGFGIKAPSGKVVSDLAAQPTATQAPVQDLPGFDLNQLQQAVPGMSPEQQELIIDQISQETEQDTQAIRDLLLGDK